MRANQDHLGHVNTQHGSLYRDGGGPLRGHLEGLALAPQTESIVNVSRKPESSGATARWGARDEMTMGRFYPRGEARWGGNASSEYPILASRKFSKVEKVLQHPTSCFEFRPYLTAGEGRLCGAQRPVAGVARTSALCPKQSFAEVHLAVPRRPLVIQMNHPEQSVTPLRETSGV